MTQVDRITEDIAHMPVAAFIFRDKESDEVHYSTDIRFHPRNSNELKKQIFVEKEPYVASSGKKSLTTLNKNFLMPRYMFLLLMMVLRVGFSTWFAREMP